METQLGQKIVIDNMIVKPVSGGKNTWTFEMSQSGNQEDGFSNYKTPGDNYIFPLVHPVKDIFNLSYKTFSQLVCKTYFILRLKCETYQNLCVTKENILIKYLF